MNEITNPLCLWCGKPFTRRPSGGSRQMFCDPRHRIAFHTAARRWAERAIASGALTIGDLRNSAAAAYTLVRGHEGRNHVQVAGKETGPSASRSGPE